LSTFCTAIDNTYRFNNIQGFSDLLAWLTCGFGVKYENTICLSIFTLVVFGLMYFMGSWREGLVNAASRKKLQHEPKLLKIVQIFLESVALSAVALLSLPKEFYPYGEKKYVKFIGRNPFRLLMVIERLFGWGLLILFINTLSRVMVHY
jgi:hypothetical protein